MGTKLRMRGLARSARNEVTRNMAVTLMCNETMMVKEEGFVSDDLRQMAEAEVSRSMPKRDWGVRDMGMDSRSSRQLYGLGCAARTGEQCDWATDRREEHTYYTKVQLSSMYGSQVVM